MENDISILVLAENVANYNPIDALDSDGGYHDNVGTDMTVAGWGATSEGGSGPDAPLRVAVPIVSHSQCNTWYGAGSITNDMICAGLQEGGKDSCQGDSGGPLFYISGNQATLVGVVSWGIGCAREDQPGVYAEVAHFRNWICTNAGVGCSP